MDPTWLDREITDAGLFGVVARIDPYLSDAWESAATEFDAVAHGIFGAASRETGSDAADVILRNLWALCERDPVRLAMVARCTMVAGGADDILLAVRGELRRLAPRDSWLHAVAGTTSIRSLSLSPGPFSATLQLRFELARQFHRPSRTAALLMRRGRVGRLSQEHYRRELRRFVSTREAQGLPMAPMGRAGLTRLPLYSRMLVAGDQVLWDALVARFKDRDAVRAEIQEAWRQARSLEKPLGGFVEALGRRDVGECDRIVGGLGDLAVDGSSNRRFARKVSAAVSNPVRDVGGWRALGGRAFGLVSALLGAGRVPAHLGLTASEIAERIAADPAFISSIPGKDLRRIQRSWTPADVERLVLDGRFGIVPGLPLAAIDQHTEPLLGVLLPLFGVPVARSAFETDSPAVLGKLVGFLEAGHSPRDRERFTTELARSIGSLFEQSSDACRQAVCLGQRFVALPGGTRLLAEGLSPAGVIGLLGSPGADGLVEVVASERRDFETCRREWATQAVAFGSEKEVVAALRAVPDLVAQVDARGAGRFVSSGDRRAAELAALSLRRDARVLKAYAKAMEPDAFAGAARAAASWLPDTSRERGFLELCAVLGADGIRLLAGVMASMQRDAAAGCKLDGLYHRYELPKDSGGKRLVAAPAERLKRLQRMILRAILDPLGNEACVHGFVSGGSIVANAAGHVRQPVVVNCDIANCFPSIGWSWVLMALRRDLSAWLCPSAISLLVDICCMGSALPIGAPTSPALLNRVLLKTDRVLQKAAEARGCRYSRYADDLTFSGSPRAVELLGVARRTLGQLGLTLDPKKTNIFRRGRRQVVTGLVVNDQVSVPRRIRRRLRSAVHAVEQGGEPTWHGKTDSMSALRGRLAFLRAVNPAEGLALAERLAKAVTGDD